MLYSLNGNYPTELPNRIRLSDGSTRTDPESFTAEMIVDAGYYEVEDPPAGLPIHQTYKWDPTQDRSNWIVVDKPQSELNKMKQDYLSEVNNEKNFLLSMYYKIKLDEINQEENSEVYDRTELDAYISALEVIEETYDEETMQVTWPLRPQPIGTN